MRSGFLGEFLIRPPRYGIGAAAVAHTPSLPTYVRITDIDSFGRFRPIPPVSVSSPQSGKFVLTDGDIVIARTGTSVGKSYRYRSTDGELVFAGFLIAIHPDPNILDPRYLEMILRSKGYWDWLAAESMRSGQPGINAQQIARLPISVPSVDRQKEAAGKIAVVDDLIDDLGVIIAKKRAIKQGMMQKLLTGRTRLTGFGERWAPHNLSELLTFEQPGRFLVSSTEYVDAGTPVLTAGKTFILGYTAETFGIYDKLPVIIFDDFTTDSKLVTFPFKAKSSAMKILSIKAGFDLRFVYERMQLIDFAAVDHKRRWITEYSKLSVEVPPLDEQRAIAQVLRDADAEIEALEKRLDATRQIKEGMMQELLTGRTRLV